MKKVASPFYSPGPQCLHRSEVDRQRVQEPAGSADLGHMSTEYGRAFGAQCEVIILIA